MSLSFNESLLKLEKLSAQKLLSTSRRVRCELGSAEWKMALCLLAAERRRSYRKLGYATITEYAERALHLSGKKTGELLGTAKALEHLPRLSAAFQTGQLCWGKLRALKGLATPESEQDWLEFALKTTTAQVVSKVAASPREWKRYQALQASLKGRPISDQKAVKEILRDSPEVGEEQVTALGPPSEASVALQSHRDQDMKLKSEQAAAVPDPTSHKAQQAKSAPPAPPETLKPQTIRVTIEMTPDEYALYERAESRARAQAGKRVSRGAAVAKMAAALLDQGTARQRARHQVLIHTDDEGLAWYETERGLLPVSPAVLQQAQQNSNKALDAAELKVLPESETQDDTKEAARQPGQASPEAETHKRTDIPNQLLRALFARARHRCERCGCHGGPLHAHHLDPVSDGGQHRLERLRLLCSPCHSLTHEADFAQRHDWRRARERAIAGKCEPADCSASEPQRVSPRGNEPVTQAAAAPVLARTLCSGGTGGGLGAALESDPPR